LVWTANPVASGSATSAPSGTCDNHRGVPHTRKKSPKLLFCKEIFFRVTKMG
jgi:hypothetical protein